MSTPDDASAPSKILEKKRKEGAHGVQRRVGKNWSCIQQALPVQKSASRSQLEALSRSLCVQNGPCSGGPVAQKGPHHAKHGPYSMKGLLVPEMGPLITVVGPLELRGSLLWAQRVPAAQKGVPSYTTGPAAWKGSPGFDGRVPIIWYCYASQRILLTRRTILLYESLLFIDEKARNQLVRAQLGVCVWTPPPPPEFCSQ